MKSKAIVFREPYEVEIAEIDVPKPAAGQVLTKTLYSGVSTGTESRVLAGGQAGGEFPLIPGYENLGQIVEAGPDVNLKPGAVVFVGLGDFTGDYCRCWGAHTQYALKDASAVVPVPEGTDPAKAVYTKVGAIALHGVKRASVCEKDTVAIVGQGLIGHFASQSCKARGATVIAVDIDAERLAAAKKAGADHIVNAKTENPAQRVKEISNGGVDVAIDATGIAKLVDSTARLVYPRPWAPPYPPHPRVVILGTSSEPIPFTYSPTLFDNEPDIFPSRDTTPDDHTEMMDLIATGKVNPDCVPAKTFHFEDAPAAYKELIDKKLMRIVFSWT